MSAKLTPVPSDIEECEDNACAGCAWCDLFGEISEQQARLWPDPSGDPTPSLADLDMTKALIAASETVGVILLDHVVVTRNPERFESMRDRLDFDRT